MGAAPDRLVDPGRASDAVSPSDDRDLRADLRERLERLPPGHPSSPYEHDGSAKPPVPNLAEHERPIPVDERTEIPDRSGDSISEKPTLSPDEDSQGLGPDGREAEVLHGELKLDEPSIIGEDGSWEWKGRHLTPEQSRIADRALERFRIAEGRDETGGYSDHGITPAMRRIESQLENGQLVDRTEEFALKSADRFKEKLVKIILDEPDADPSEVVEHVNDGIRYTYIFDIENYSNGVMEVCEALTEAGFEQYERKNSWADHTKSYQGVNSTWRDGDGQLFEVQIHTPASWDAKQESHKAYEIIESPRSTHEERKKAKELQDQIFASVPVPDGVLTIPSGRKETW